MANTHIISIYLSNVGELLSKHDEARRLENMSLEQILDDPVSVPFHDQVLVVLYQSGPLPTRNATMNAVKVTMVLGIERNQNASTYTVHNLHRNLHLSCSRLQFYFICKKIYEIQGLQFQSKVVPITFVSNKTACYESSDSKIIVHNYVEGGNWENSMNTELLQIKMKVLESCREGLCQHFRFESSKRTGNERKKSPVIHTGLSTTDAHRYSFNRSTQLAHIRPFLVDSYLGSASLVCRRSLGCAIAMGNMIVQKSPCVFKLDDRKCSEFRKNLRLEYQSFFGFDGKSKQEKPITDHFCHEANTILVNHSVRQHFDSLNDPLFEMSGMYFSMSTFQNSIAFHRRRFLIGYIYLLNYHNPRCCWNINMHQKG